MARDELLTVSDGGGVQQDAFYCLGLRSCCQCVRAEHLSQVAHGSSQGPGFSPRMIKILTDLT